MSHESKSDFPSQKKSLAQKNKQWRKNCVDAGENSCLFINDGIRKSYRNKRINYDLYSDILDQSDIEQVCNPLGVLGMEAPAKVQNYPICNPKIDLLVGEAINRKFDWKVRVLNDDAISQKEVELKEQFSKMMQSHLQDQNLTEDKMQEELKRFSNYANYEYQDLREVTSTRILQYLTKHLRMDYKWSKGLKDAFICAEEIYQVDIVAGEPVFNRLNPLNVATARSGDSPYIEDSDVITITGYHSPGKIIDDYHEYLTPAQVTQIEQGSGRTTGSSKGLDIGRKSDLALNVDDAIDLALLENNLDYGSPFDKDGNIRVSKVYWKSLRKMLKVKFYDEFGDEQYELFDETYKVKEDKGEEAEILWVNEWWEGHKIGGGSSDVDDESAIYVRMQPRPLQFRSLENPSKCYPGIIGTIYNTNDNVGVSLMDRMKPYQYLYNILAYNTELAIAKNKGKIMRLDLAQIPENWDVDKWMSFAQGMSIGVYDSFKEGNKGASQGKLAGGMSAQSPVIDMEMGNTIQLYMNMMSFIKQEMGEIAGVDRSRQGQIQAREAVGNVERSMTQSSHITEYWFLEHDQLKIRCLEALLETAKFAWRDKKNKKVQYVLDEGSTVILNIDVQKVNECEYGLNINNSSNNAELLNSMKQLAHASIQNGILNFSQLIDIFSTDSMASIRRKIQKSEVEKEQRDAEQAKQAEKMQEQQIAAAAQAAEKERAFKREEWDREDARTKAELETKLEIERMRQDNVEGKHFDGGDSESTLESLKLQAEKIDKDYKAKEDDLREKIRHNKATEEISRSKKSSTEKK